jgi:hypothetical protein
MKLEELKKALDKSDYQTCNRFMLEEAMMGMYRIAEDLDLALDGEERRTVIKMHLMRTDNLFEVFENMVLSGRIT